MSPPASARATLQSMIPAPVRSRRALTSLAETSTIAASLFARARCPVGLRGGDGRLLRLLAGALLGLLALALLLCLPPSLLLLGAALRLGLSPSLRRLEHRLADGADHEVAGADRVVVARDRIV